MAVNKESTPTKLSKIISDRMDERGVTINQLAEKLDIVYEHTRRIVRGIVVPSKFVLKAICEELKLPYKELLDMAKEAKMMDEYGDVALKLAGKKPSMQPLERIWDDLTTEQQKDIISMAQGWVKRARATGH